LLTGQSWHGDAIPYNQNHVRNAFRSRGYWMINVEQPGNYTIELRRWPSELNRAIDKITEQVLEDPAKFDLASSLLKLPSRAVQAKAARVQVGEFDRTHEVRPGDTAVTFRTHLARGEQKLEASFTTADGDEQGAYYVYIEPASAAAKRHLVDDSRNEFFTLFRYSPVKGLGYEEGVGRRDPSSIIKAGNFYYVWYTRIAGQKPVRGENRKSSDRRYRWDLAEIWYATSPDGYRWTERGAAVKPGPKGSFDDRSVFTTNILVANGKYYLVYQAVKAPYGPSTRNVVGMAKADSPDGPWTKLPKPILATTPDGKWRHPVESRPHDYLELGSWDSAKVHDPGILVRDGKYWLYYKGQQIGRYPF
ncbi:MAG: hypothetical protein GY953_22795, partial [bacterium]|nr:hypothetical protein [bacterium]